MNSIVSTLARFRPLLSLTPLETATSYGRARERYRRVVIAAVAGGAARAINVVTLLVAIPLTVGYLGSERYGVWVTLGSLLALIGIADLGVGYGLISRISEAVARDDRLLARQAVTSALVVLGAMGALAVGAFALLYARVDWARVTNVEGSTAASEAGPAIAVLVICLALSVPLSGLNKVQLGLQEGFTANLWNAGGNVVALVAVISAALSKAGVPWLVAAQIGAPLVPAAVNGGLLFGRRHTWLRPRLRYFSGALAQSLLRSGGWFVLLQVGMALTLYADLVIVSQVLGPRAATTYAVPLRLFMLTPFALALVLVPLWPAYADALARGEYTWMSRALRRALIGGAAATAVASILLVASGPRLIELWVGSDLGVSRGLLTGLGLWAMVHAVWTVLSTYANGIGALRLQGLLVLATGIVNVGAAIVTLRSVGLEGLPYAMALTQLLCNVCPLLVLLPRSTARAISRSRAESKG